MLMLLIVCQAMSQTPVIGIVTDGQVPLTGANVFIEGTIDGCLTDTLGRFSFETAKTGEVTLRATYMGFDDFTLTTSHPTDLRISMHERATTIDEVVVTASTYNFSKSDNFNTMDALDVVMTGNSCGDIVAALQSLPGTQKVGEDGKLYVRGGESEECQFFINGMHVLMPYSTNVQNTTVRGRFSPFLFKGINFTLGGYGGEYGQALSSVLPMETTDQAIDDKIGVSASLVDWNLGGTKAFGNSSLSFNADFTSMGLYDQLFPGRFNFTRPYRKLSGETQFKTQMSSSNVTKCYAGYDLTSAGQHIEQRNLSLSEHNIYLNTSSRTNIGHGYSLFIGAANSTVFTDIDDAMVAGDHFYSFRNETHLKTEVRRVFSPVLKMSAGVEDYIRNSRKVYDTNLYNLHYNLLAAHADAQLRLVPRLFLSLSARMEHTSYDHKWLWMPRTTLSYVPHKRFQLSAMLGRYSQTADDDYIAMSRLRIPQSTADHAILSLQYNTQSILFRIESYYKRYRHLPWFPQGDCNAGGYGTSRGLDLFVENHSIVKHLVTTLAYSFNDSERLYLDYTAPQAPGFASRHNLRLTAKYSIGKFIFGLADSYASGRKYPMQTTPHYHSLDANVTWLAHPKVIVYSSLSNILGRTPIFKYEGNGTPVTSTRDRFFYIGIFISLKNNKAYDISNF